MTLIDLTHPFQPDIAVFPGDEQVKIDHVKTLERDGFNNYRLTTGMHVGTHIDGPMHMTSDQRMISQLPLDRFAGRGVLIDVRGETQIAFREEFRELIRRDDIVLFYSGLDIHFGSPHYFTEYPDITEELAGFLAGQNLKMIGIDWVSPDHEPYPIHEILFNGDVLILENLTNLGHLIHETNFEVYAFPLRIEADSSIVRAVARVK